MYVIEISCWWSKEPCKCLVFITGFINFMKGLSENKIQIWCRCLSTRWKIDQGSWCRNYVIDFNEMCGCNSFDCPIDKALVRNKIIKFDCSYLGLAVIIINQNDLSVCWRSYQSLNPHSICECHRSTSSYCRSMLFHELLGDIRVSSALYRFRFMF